MRAVAGEQKCGSPGLCPDDRVAVDLQVGCVHRIVEGGRLGARRIGMAIPLRGVGLKSYTPDITGSEFIKGMRRANSSALYHCALGSAGMHRQHSNPSALGNGCELAAGYMTQHTTSRVQIVSTGGEHK